MNASIDHSASPNSPRRALAEVALVFAVFFAQGASPVPDVNEPYYLGKAIHYWNPDWARGDFFLDSADTHEVFCFTFGWLALWLSPPVLAWFGRLLTWWLLAWAWQRLSFAVVPRRWYSILTAALFVCLLERCHMAGEWVVGGVEAKGFAFVLVLLGLEALVRDRWNRAWLLLGASAAFHVLVGGWSVVAAGIVWLVLGKGRPALRPMVPAIVGGFLLSLPGLIPSLVLNWGTDGETVRLAHQIYVFERLAHHLSPMQLPTTYCLRFGLMLVLWLVLCHLTPPDEAGHRLRAFVAGTLVLSAVGATIGLLTYGHPASAAALLRFYWFRLADVAVPLGVAVTAATFLINTLRRDPAVGRRWLAFAVAVAGVHVGIHAVQRPFPESPPADRFVNYYSWRQACNWVARSGRIPPDARFITPRMSQTFKWYAGRSEVANWKEIPQDAEAIVAWWRRIESLYATGLDGPEDRWHESLAEMGAARLQWLAAMYDAEYVITTRRPPLDLERVYRNRRYVVYRLPKSE
ncbi:MAG: hypothetical protein JXB62_02715 [Pirellulales bacterium]|nr:hypothetical protein [Pirellulales bacterium]